MMSEEFCYEPLITHPYGVKMAKIKLVHLAHARSGDKGDTANIGLIALKPEYYPLLVEQVTAERVKAHFKAICFGEVERFEVPNLEAMNFLLHNSLDGGGTISLKTDAQGKTYSTALLRMEIDVDDEVAREALGNQ
jgi:hypothetical protein